MHLQKEIVLDCRILQEIRDNIGREYTLNLLIVVADDIMLFALQSWNSRSSNRSFIKIKSICDI